MDSGVTCSTRKYELLQPSLKNAHIYLVSEVHAAVGRQIFNLMIVAAARDRRWLAICSSELAMYTISRDL